MSQQHLERADSAVRSRLKNLSTSTLVGPRPANDRKRQWLQRFEASIKETAPPCDDLTPRQARRQVGGHGVEHECALVLEKHAALGKELIVPVGAHGGSSRILNACLLAGLRGLREAVARPLVVDAFEDEIVAERSPPIWVFRTISSTLLGSSDVTTRCYLGSQHDRFGLLRCLVY